MLVLLHGCILLDSVPSAGAAFSSTFVLTLLI